MTVQTAGTLPAPLSWLHALWAPESALAWSVDEWQLAVRQSRRLRVLARLGSALDAAGLLDSIPPQAARHLRAELRVSAWRTCALLWAIDRVGVTLAPLGAPVVLLKGAAYCVQGLSISAGRMPSDLDILVPFDRLGDARKLLADAGWFELELEVHDREYYERFSHELPPMQHPVLAMELDVHHNIVPNTMLAQVEEGLLLAAVKPASRGPWSVLDPVDQALHAAVHLVLDGEPADRVRDLIDLHCLLCRAHLLDPSGERLGRRAAELGLTVPLRLATGVAVAWFGLPEATSRLPFLEDKGPWFEPILANLSLRALTPGWPGAAESMSKRLAVTLLQAGYRATRLPWRFALAHAWRRLRPRAMDPASAKPK